MIKGGGGKSSGYSADLMVCFPSRTHFSLPSKSICSPSHSLNRRQNASHHRRSLSKLSVSGGIRHNEGEEPTSPKVTCAGQIKIKPSKHGGSKNWQSLMAEIEKIHRNKSESKFLGIKKDVTGFLTCLRDLRLDFRCFGAFPPADVISDDEEEEEDEEDEEEEEEESSGTVFSKWFMVLHEKQDTEEYVDKKDNAFSEEDTAIPPPNALLLMRCRSAPVKNMLEKEEEEEKKKEVETENNEKQSGEEEEEEKEKSRKNKDLRSLMEEEKKMNMVVMSYDTNYYRLSADIAKETWVIGGIQDPLFRSRSCNK